MENKVFTTIFIAFISRANVLQVKTKVMLLWVFINLQLAAWIDRVTLGCETGCLDNVSLMKMIT